MSSCTKRGACAPRPRVKCRVCGKECAGFLKEKTYLARGHGTRVMSCPGSMQPAELAVKGLR